MLKPWWCVYHETWHDADYPGDDLCDVPQEDDHGHGPFACRCGIPDTKSHGGCPYRATQEDGLCDGCRAEHGHVWWSTDDGETWSHIGLNGGDALFSWMTPT